MARFRVIDSSGETTETDCMHVVFAASGIVQFYRDSHVNEKGSIVGKLVRALSSGAWHEVIRIDEPEESD